MECILKGLKIKIYSEVKNYAGSSLHKHEKGNAL